jgi:hypothetical protein
MTHINILKRLIAPFKRLLNLKLLSILHRAVYLKNKRRRIAFFEDKFRDFDVFVNRARVKLISTRRFRGQLRFLHFLQLCDFMLIHFEFLLFF